MRRFPLGRASLMALLELRGLSPEQEPTDVVERFELVGRTASWRSPVDSGTTTVDTPRYYPAYEDNPYGVSQLARYLLGQAEQTADLLPFGSARASSNGPSDGSPRT